ncbi:MAG: hypothetical protein ABW185_29550 [Sedimenticola sp.]
MAKLSDSLKQILSGLAYQDVEDYLSMHEKMKVLGQGTESGPKPSVTKPIQIRKPATHRIALISDGRGLGAPLDYVIDACSLQSAKIDLLIHGAVDTASIAALEKQIAMAGLQHHRIQLGVNAVEDIVNYICNHSALIFMVAMPDDVTAKTLVEEVIPQRGGRISVPLVLIEDRPPMHSVKKSAA